MNHLESITTTLDIRIRGEVGYIFSLIETQLLKIIIFSKAYKLEEKPVILRKIQLMNKIQMAQGAIKRMDDSLYRETDSLFQILLSKVDFRNVMTHCKFEWDISDLTYFMAWDIEQLDDEDKTQHHKLVKYSLIDVADTNTLIMGVYNLLQPIVNRFEVYGYTQKWI